jgi:vacuolar protein sorting-associated protein 13A/C
MSRYLTKIVDNVQLTVKNIHIRYEDEFSAGAGSNFSFGLTLKEFSANTTNQNWQTGFYDRLVAENRDKPLFKKFNI